MRITRRRFLGHVVAAPFAAVVAGRFLSACGSDDFEEKHRFTVTAGGLTVLTATQKAVGGSVVNYDRIPVSKDMPGITARFVYEIGRSGQWVYTLNGEEPNAGVLAVDRPVNPGDEIVWLWAPEAV